MHLAADTSRRLTTRSMPGPEALALASHLEGPCETCEAFLAERPGVDAFDGAVDAGLLALAPPSSTSAGHDLEYARIERRVRGARPRSRWLPGVGIAAALAVAGVAGLLVTRPPGQTAWDGAKGAAAQVVPLRLRFLVVTPAVGGPPALERGLDGQEVPAAASLQFQVELGRPAFVLLARSGLGGAGAEVFLSTRLPAGRHVVTLNGQPAAYPLASLAGRQRFMALASEAPLGARDADRAARSSPASGAAAEPPDGERPISVDQVDVLVRP